MAFLCAEYGDPRLAPDLFGGLGALAGDLVKEASDRALPLVAVGLMYRKGYFRQRIDALGLAARVLDRHRSRAAAGRARDGRGRRAADGRGPDLRRQRDCADLARRRRPRPAVPARHRLPRERAGRSLDHRSPVRRRSRNAPRAVRRCSASAASARCARSGSSRASSTSTRATPRSPRSSSLLPGCATATGSMSRSPPPASGPCSPPTLRSLPATTPIRPSR